MRFPFSLFTLLILLSACSEPTSDTTTNNNQQQNDRISHLEKESARKDSMINESLAFFNEIQSNLEAIELKRTELKIRSSNAEIAPEDKKWILEQIRHINYLREENAKKVRQLNKQLNESGLKIKELETMIQNLLKNIQAKDEEINMLQGELGALDKAYSKLFDAYQEKAELVASLTETINTVYYSYGTEEELLKNQVIERKNGFIGIGKRIKLLDNFNEKYFARIDLTKDKEIFVEGSDIKFITDHPSSSYTLVPVGRNTKIKIANPRDFWKVSKYLVVVVD